MSAELIEVLLSVLLVTVRFVGSVFVSYLMFMISDFLLFL